MLHHDKAESHEIKENQSCDSCYLVAVSHKFEPWSPEYVLFAYAAVITSCLPVVKPGRQNIIYKYNTKSSMAWQLV